VAEVPTDSHDTSAAVPELVLTEEQRAVFQSAGLWVMIWGWIEVLGGVLLAVLWLLGWWNVVPLEQVS
jgi:hypothetical protein